MIPEIKVVECNTVGEAEAEYFFLREQGCWQIKEPMKIVWSWKKFRKVARFTVKKVEKVYDFESHMKDLNKCIKRAMEVLPGVVEVFSQRNKRKAEQRLKELLKS